MYYDLFQQKKNETKVEEEESSIKPVLKEANYSDDDVWEPSLRKEKSYVTANKPSRHSGNKKVQYLRKSTIVKFYDFLWVYRRKSKEGTALRHLLENIVAERGLLHLRIQEVKAKWKNHLFEINQRWS